MNNASAEKKVEDNMSDLLKQYMEEYAQKRIQETDEKTAFKLLRNGVSIDLIRKSISSLSEEFIEKLRQEQLARAL